MPEYIQIDSVDDIDVKKIRPTDLQNRYIDKNGNRYAVKFNARTRKLSIVQIIKGKSEIHKVRDRRVTSDPIVQSQVPPAEAEDEEGTTNNLDNLDAEPEKDIPADKLNRTVVSDMVSSIFVKSRDRLKAVHNHLKKSNYFEKDPDPRAKNYVMDFSRAVDNDCVKNMEQSISLITELNKFPRPLSHYLNKLTPSQKRRIEAIAGEDNKMGLIKDWELQEAFLSTMKDVEKTIEELMGRIKSPKSNVTGQLGYAEKQSLQDAKVSAEYALKEVVRARKTVEAWKLKSD